MAKIRDRLKAGASVADLGSHHGLGFGIGDVINTYVRCSKTVPPASLRTHVEDFALSLPAVKTMTHGVACVRNCDHIVQCFVRQSRMVPI